MGVHLPFFFIACTLLCLGKNKTKRYTILPPKSILFSLVCNEINVIYQVSMYLGLFKTWVCSETSNFNPALQSLFQPLLNSEKHGSHCLQYTFFFYSQNKHNVVSVVHPLAYSAVLSLITCSQDNVFQSYSLFFFPLCFSVGVLFIHKTKTKNVFHFELPTYPC